MISHTYLAKLSIESFCENQKEENEQEWLA